MKLLITGGAGFIGSHLADIALARGDDVLVIDNFATGRRDNLKAHKNLTVVEGTIADRKLVARAFDDLEPDIVIHAAASYKDPDNWEADSLTNVLGTALVVQEAERHNVRRLIYFQTALCYGLQPDTQPISLDHELRPKDSSYAISKTGGEYYIGLSRLDWISFRLANAYGPRNLSGPLPTFYHRLTNGKPCFVMDTRRDFIFIDDLVSAVVRAIDGEGQCGVYHISSGGDYSIKELFDNTVKKLGITLEKPVEVRPRHPDDAFTILLDPSKTKRDFKGWSIKMSLDDGIEQTINYYQEYGISDTYTHLREHVED